MILPKRHRMHSLECFKHTPPVYKPIFAEFGVQVWPPEYAPTEC